MSVVPPAFHCRDCIVKLAVMEVNSLTSSLVEFNYLILVVVVQVNLRYPIPVWFSSSACSRTEPLVIIDRGSSRELDILPTPR